MPRSRKIPLVGHYVYFENPNAPEGALGYVPAGSKSVYYDVPETFPILKKKKSPSKKKNVRFYVPDEKPPSYEQYRKSVELAKRRSREAAARREEQRSITSDEAARRIDYIQRHQSPQDRIRNEREFIYFLEHAIDHSGSPRVRRYYEELLNYAKRHSSPSRKRSYNGKCRNANGRFIKCRV